MSADYCARYVLHALESRRLLSSTLLSPIGSAIPFATLMASGDFNNDGRADLLVRTSSSTFSSARLGPVKLHLGTGGGRFSSAGFLVSAGANVSGIALADFNDDGNLDAAFANNLAAGRVTVALGSGNGRFQPSSFALPTSYLAGANTTGVAVGDFTGDGELDLIVSNAARWREAGSSDPITFGAGILPGNGDGTFRSVQQVVLDGPQQAVVVGDLDDDGDSDAVLSGTVGNSTTPLAHVLISDGAGGVFATDFVPFTTGTIAGIALAAIDGLGGDDIALLAAPTPGTAAANVTPTILRTYLAGSSGAFTAGPIASTRVVRPAGLSAADVDRDGRIDFIVAGSAPGTTPNVTGGAVSILTRPTGGAFARAQLFRTTGRPIAQFVAHLDGDNRVDVLTGGALGVSALPGRFLA